jgi:hypothetical protein
MSPGSAQRRIGGFGWHGALALLPPSHKSICVHSTSSAIGTGINTPLIIASPPPRNTTMHAVAVITALVLAQVASASPITSGNSDNLLACVPTLDTARTLHMGHALQHYIAFRPTLGPVEGEVERVLVRHGLGVAEARRLLVPAVDAWALKLSAAVGLMDPACVRPLMTTCAPAQCARRPAWGQPERGVMHAFLGSLVDQWTEEDVLPLLRSLAAVPQGARALADEGPEPMSAVVLLAGARCPVPRRVVGDWIRMSMGEGSGMKGRLVKRAGEEILRTTTAAATTSNFNDPWDWSADDLARAQGAGSSPIIEEVPDAPATPAPRPHRPAPGSHRSHGSHGTHGNHGNHGNHGSHGSSSHGSSSGSSHSAHGIGGAAEHALQHSLEHAGTAIQGSVMLFSANQVYAGACMVVENKGGVFKGLGMIVTGLVTQAATLYASSLLAEKGPGVLHTLVDRLISPDGAAASSGGASGSGTTSAGGGDDYEELSEEE